MTPNEGLFMRLYKPKPTPTSSIYERIYHGVRQIPAGKVTTYGQIAKMVGYCTARMVGYALAALPKGANVPWQRVINHKGEVSRRAQGDGSLYQRRLLEQEGICFDSYGRVDFKKVYWNGSLHRGSQKRKHERFPEMDRSG
jgi:methylated-DNA-protein-cysteine methyltransferase-like protein